MPQLARMTINSGLPLNFRWPYHAKVMKMFEQVNKMTGSQRDSVQFMPQKMGFTRQRVKSDLADA